MTLPGQMEGCTGAGTFSKSVKPGSIQKTERRSWVLQLMSRCRVRAANAFPDTAGEHPQSWATWGMGVAGAWIPQSQLDYLLLPLGAGVVAKVWDDALWRFSDHRPVLGSLGVRAETEESEGVAITFAITGWAPLTPEDAGRFRRGLCEALDPSPGVRAGARKVRFAEQRSFSLPSWRRI